MKLSNLIRRLQEMEKLVPTDTEVILDNGLVWRKVDEVRILAPTAHHPQYRIGVSA